MTAYPLDGPPYPEVVHRGPTEEGSHTLPCCGRTILDPALKRDRVTTDDRLVTCRGGR